MIFEAARDRAQRLIRTARGDFPQHDIRARILSGADPHDVARKLQRPGNPGTRERRLRQAGRILDYAGDRKLSQRIYSGLLDRNPAQPLWVKHAAGVPAHDVILLDEYRIAYCPIPKNASSSIKARINFLMRGTNDVYSHRFFTDVYETSQTAGLPDLAGYFSFTVVRDPVERLISYYQKNIMEEGTLARELEINRAKEVLPVRPSLSEFVAQLGDYIFYFDDVHHHTLPQAAYIKSVLPHLTRVYRISEVDSIFAELSSRTGAELDPTYLLKSSVGARDLLPHLGAPLRHKLTAFYDDDYELLAAWIGADRPPA